MEITSVQYHLIEDLLPLQRGNVKLSNLNVLNAILYVAEKNCKWRNLPKEFGNWHSIYTRANRWAKSGILDKVFQTLQENNIIRLKIDRSTLNNSIINLTSNINGKFKKTVFNLSVNYQDNELPEFVWSSPVKNTQTENSQFKNCEIKKE